MDWIEIIQLKSYTGSDRNEAIAAFQQLTPHADQTTLQELNLFQSLSLDNELSLLISWHGDAPQGGKSRLGQQLAEAFSEFGHIYHSGWKHSVNLLTEVWRCINGY